MKAALTVAVLVFSGCGHAVYFSQMGPDTFAVETGQSFNGRQQANHYCSNMGKRVLITNSQQRMDGSTTVFRCLNPSDPEYQRPTYQRDPDVIIQDNRKR